VRPHRARSRAVSLVLAATTASLVLAGCSDDPATPAGTAAPTTSATPSPTPTAEPAPEPRETWPLTGLKLERGKSSARKHPVMVLKMDNTSSSAPQRGLGSADLVVEELVEGGLTRLAAFFYSDIPGTVGPVRSMRSSDIGIVQPVDGAMVTSGAAPITIRRIQGAGIRFFGEGSRGFFRDSSRSAPYNLFTDMSETTELVRTKKAQRPADYLPWGARRKLPRGRPATSLSASFSYAHTTTWTYEGTTYRNVNTHAAADDQFLADTVLVLRVPVGDAGYRDPAGNPVPETELEGQGEALLLHRGRVVTARWSKASLGSTIELRAGGEKLVVPRGNTWIELVPEATGSVTVG